MISDKEKKALLEAELEYEKYIKEVMRIIQDKLSIIVDYRTKLSQDRINSIHEKLKGN